MHTYVIQGNADVKELDIYHLIFAPTYSCNLRCRQCYLPDHSTHLLPRTKALRLLRDWTEIVLSERGRFGGIFHIKGGEPFVVRYFRDLVEKLASDGSLVFMITTNGTLQDTNLCDLGILQKANSALEDNFIVNVSLDGASEEVHSLLRGPGNFDKTVSFIEALRTRDITVHLNCVIHQHNVNDIPRFVDLALEQRINQVNFLPFVPKGYGGDIWEWAVPPIEIHLQVARLYSGGDDAVKELLSGSYADIFRREQQGQTTSNECVGGYRGLFYIVPNGDVFSCPNLVDQALRIGNVNQTTLTELHQSVKNTLYPKISTCNGCSSRYVCKGESLLTGSREQVGTRRDQLNELQSFLTALSPDSIPETNSVGASYCFSRNL